MPAEQSLRDGDLKAALAELQEQVRRQPGDAKPRIFLFQLLSVLGQWERALTQLDVVRDLDAGTLAMAQAYREALHCEALRPGIFAGQRSPMVFGEPQQWVALLFEALRLTAAEKYKESQEARAQAFEDAPGTSGTLDGREFEWIADADSRLGPMLEAIVDGKYYWIPFHRVRKIQIEEPVDLRDVVWMPCHFTWANGGETVGLIPTRYPGSEASEDSSILMARRTDWAQRPAEIYLGLGQRMLATDLGEHSLMDVRSISLNPVNGA